MTTFRRKISAHSLVEMLAAISISTILLGVGMQLVNRSISLSSLSQERDRMQLTLGRLVADLRHDIHRAESVNISSQDDRPFKLEIDSSLIGAISYRQMGKVVVREVTEDNVTPHREYYRFDSDTEFELFEIAAPQGISMKVVHRSLIKGEKPQLLAYSEIETGRLLRLSTVKQTFSEGAEE